MYNMYINGKELRKGRIKATGGGNNKGRKGMDYA